MVKKHLEKAGKSGTSLKGRFGMNRAQWILTAVGSLAVAYGAFSWISHKRVERWEHISTLERVILKSSAPSLLAGLAEQGSHPAFKDGQELLSLCEWDGKGDAANQELVNDLCGRVVAIPLATSEGTELPLLFDGAEEGNSVQIPCNLSYEQVVLFVSPHPDKQPNMVRACVSRGRNGARGFYHLTLILEESVPEARRRSGREYFSIAERLWDAAEKRDKEAFDVAFRDFAPADEFLCRSMGDQIVLSGEQLALMGDVLSEHWADDDQGKP